MTARELIETLTEAEEEPRHQRLMNKAYARWQKGGDLEGVSREDFYGKLEEPYKMAVVYGNLNHQVLNGGFGQWYGNGYGDDSLDLLKAYAAKYGAKYPALMRVRGILGKIENIAEDAGAFDKYDTIGEWLDHVGDVEEDLVNAINDEDWDKMDELLGGTDFDVRSFNNLLDEEVRTTLDVTVSVGDTKDEIRQNAKDLLATGKGKWSFKVSLYGVKLFDSRDADEERLRYFDNKLDAEDAGLQYGVEFDELPDNLQEKIKEAVKEEITNEYRGHVKDPHDAIDSLSDVYGKLSPALLAELATLFDTEYPDTVAGKAKELLAKGKGAVTAKVDQVKKSVGGAVDRVKRAAGAAARELRKEDLAVGARNVVEGVAKPRS